MTKKKLLEAGYKQHKPYNGAAEFYQRRVTFHQKANDTTYKLYFINVQKWVHVLPGKDKPIVHWVAEARFYQHEDKHGFGVELFGCEDRSIEEIEVFFDHLYQQLCCVPDIHNN